MSKNVKISVMYYVNGPELWVYCRWGGRCTWDIGVVIYIFDFASSISIAKTALALSLLICM